MIVGHRCETSNSYLVHCITKIPSKNEPSRLLLPEVDFTLPVTCVPVPEVGLLMFHVLECSHDRVIHLLLQEFSV